MRYFLFLHRSQSGEVSERSNVPDSKSGVPQGTGGSNPSLSAAQASRPNGPVFGLKWRKETCFLETLNQKQKSAQPTACLGCWAPPWGVPHSAWESGMDRILLKCLLTENDFRDK